MEIRSIKDTRLVSHCHPFSYQKKQFNKLMTKKQKYGTTYKKSTCKTNIKRLNCLGIGQISCRKKQPPQFNIEVIQGKACFSLCWTILTGSSIG